MKNFRLAALPMLLLSSCYLQAAPIGIDPELLAWNLRTTVEAYEKAGSKNPSWDAGAKRCLKTFAELRSTTNSNGSGLSASLATNLPKVMALKCDDAMLRYLNLRYVLVPGMNSTQAAAAYSQLALALKKTQYPAIRKFYLEMWVYRTVTEAHTVENPNVPLDNAAAFLAEALKDKTMPEKEVAVCCGELMSPPEWADPIRWRCYRRLEPALTNKWSNTSFAQLAKGQAYLSYAWDARGRGYANTVSNGGWELMAERLTIASDALEKAWKLNPQNPTICVEMMRVELGQGKGRQRLETWFNRGMKLDPAGWYLGYMKLEYLRPRWYGTIPEMISFGRECMTNSNWSGEVRLGLANAHYEASREMPDKKAREAYLAQPSVWSDIRTNYEFFLKLYPDQFGYRHNYARFARYAGDWDGFLRQVKLFPWTNYAYFGGVERFNQDLETARQHAHPKK